MFARILRFLWPGWGKVVVTCVALLLTLLVVTYLEATSNAMWEEARGAPLPFLVVRHIGPSTSHAFLFAQLIFDLVGWYLVSCIIILTWQVLEKQRKKKTMFARILRFLWPGWSKVTVTCVVLLLSLLVVTDRRAASMSGVVWEDARGAPLPFLLLTEFRGLLVGQDPINRIYIDAFLPENFILNLVVWYLASCLLYDAYRKVFRLDTKAGVQPRKDVL